MGKETYCYEPDGDKWYKLADTHWTYTNTNPYKMCSFQEKLYVFPSSPNVCYKTAEMFDPSLNGWTTFDYQTGQASRQTFGLAVVRGQLFAGMMILLNGTVPAEIRSFGGVYSRHFTYPSIILSQTHGSMLIAMEVNQWLPEIPV